MNPPSGIGRLTQTEIERGLHRLPVLPATVMQLLELIQRDDADAEQVARTIARDPGLTARLLRLANSPFFGVTGQITSVKQACVVLGLYTVRNLAAAVSVNTFFHAAKGNVLDRRRLWRHAIETAIAAKGLANRCNQNGETALTAGLLHDLGKLAMDACFADAVEYIEGYQNLYQCMLVEAEKEVIGMDHGQLGAIVAERWHLPVLMQRVIAGHHGEEQEMPHPIVDIVCLANLVCDNFSGEKPEQVIQNFPEKTVLRLGLDLATLQDWLTNFAEERRLAESLTDI